MNQGKSPISTCRYCRFYQPDGLHGGTCQQLSVAVRGEWGVCSLALPAFTPSWTGVDEIAQTWSLEEDSVVVSDLKIDPMTIVGNFITSSLTDSRS
jgi:hypothetical protein